MAQTPREPTRRNSYFAPGTRVHTEDRPEETGVVVESDDFYDAMKLRGVAEAQVLVEWPRGGKPVRTWERPDHLVLLPDTAEMQAIRPEVRP